MSETKYLPGTSGAPSFTLIQYEVRCANCDWTRRVLFAHPDETTTLTHYCPSMYVPVRHD